MSSASARVAEDGPESASAAWAVASCSALSVSMVEAAPAADDLKASVAGAPTMTFAPAYTYALYRDEEIIGFRAPSINLMLSAHCLTPFVDCSYDDALPPQLHSQPFPGNDLAHPLQSYLRDGFVDAPEPPPATHSCADRAANKDVASEDAAKESPEAASLRRPPAPSAEHILDTRILRDRAEFASAVSAMAREEHLPGTVVAQYPDPTLLEEDGNGDTFFEIRHATLGPDDAEHSFANTFNPDADSLKRAKGGATDLPPSLLAAPSVGTDLNPVAAGCATRQRSVRRFVRRLALLSTMFIDTAQPLDVNDCRWNVLLLFRCRPSAEARRAAKPEAAAATAAAPRSSTPAEDTGNPDKTTTAETNETTKRKRQTSSPGPEDDIESLSCDSQPKNKKSRHAIMSPPPPSSSSSASLDRPVTRCFVGYLAYYNFFVYPNNRRLRVAHLLVLPPFRRAGHGMRLYDQFMYMARSSAPKRIEALRSADDDEAAATTSSFLIDTGFEAPAESVDIVRDVCDLGTLVRFAGLAALADSFADSSADSSAEALKSLSTAEFTLDALRSLSFLARSSLSKNRGSTVAAGDRKLPSIDELCVVGEERKRRVLAIRRAMKLSRKQADRMYEMYVLLRCLPGKVPNAYLDMISDRLRYANRVDRLSVTPQEFESALCITRVNIVEEYKMRIKVLEKHISK